MNSVLNRPNTGTSLAERTATLKPEDAHGVCWAAVFAGAVGASVLSLILLLLGTGIGFSAVSPWADHGATATTIGVSTILWMTLVQILASLLGGYLAGRLRSTWASLQNHEAYFRDTAHGFLAWSVATLVTATLLSSAVGSMTGAGLNAGASIAGNAATVARAGAAGGAGDAASSAPGGDMMGYFNDLMFRPTAAQSPAPATAIESSQTPSTEVGRIFGTSLRRGSLSQADSQYMAQLVSQRTGIPDNEAQKRVSDAFAQLQQAIQDAKTHARTAADVARKALRASHFG